MKLPRPNRRALAFLHDTAMAAAAFLLALYLRMGSDWSVLPPGSVSTSLALFTLTCGSVFLASGLYRSIWAFASMRDLTQILRAVTIAVVAFIILAFVLTRLEGVPRTAPFIAWFILLAGLGGSRMAFRLWRERRLSALWERSGGGRINVLLVGAGDEADLFMRAVSSNPQAPFHVVGIVGENEKRVGRSIHGVDVLGSVEELPALIEKLKSQDKAPSRLVLTRAVTRFNSPLVTQLLEQSAALGLGLSRLPALTELRNDVAAALTMRDQPLALEDLLGRPETKLNRNEIRTLVKGRRVLVTGAGGTIGAELTRQIAALEPQHLILLESSEFNLYRIEMEIKETFPYQNIRAIIADVRDAARLDKIFQDEKPNLVFHAAALKHVPIAEENPREAILTNVHGTRLVADCAMKAKVAAMVLISTDKAVHPSSVMGATKRLAEMYCQACDLASDTTRFITVRFGNVLGSTGSVVPRFQEQLAKGGPLTVTHPDITRYFMTVREAVELVLQASALGMQPGDQRGKVLVLDMGQPVKIADLARQIIRLAGYKPDEDIKITYTGLRPGEKLHEELFTASEELIPSAADGVKLAKSPTRDLPAMRQALSDLAQSMQASPNDHAAVESLSILIPEFRQEDAPLQAAAG
ncbi:MAG: nucleoside-diphosphate sugar epimerase/dehydratase [Alphaproteobacteria bacterium]|nr:nucleoside-diphosphate sugar epimerase/dehydratase [Alphaproteobacteria bacterium]